MKCLDEVIQHMKLAKPDSYKSRFVRHNDEINEDDVQNEVENTSFMNGIKEVVWLEEEIREKEDEILEAEVLDV